jgi:hypothetical protein
VLIVVLSLLDWCVQVNGKQIHLHTCGFGIQLSEDIYSGYLIKMTQIQSYRDRYGPALQQYDDRISTEIESYSNKIISCN